MNKQQITYEFWEENVKCYELHTIMHQTNEQFMPTLKLWIGHTQTPKQNKICNISIEIAFDLHQITLTFLISFV